MAVSVSYPGVYVQEIPSGVRTITGVSTSIAAFVGWAPAGPSDEAVLVTSWGEYVEIFGGLDSRSNLGYAVNQFFTNGGQLAYIVRLVGRDEEHQPANSSVRLGNDDNHLQITASSEGVWGDLYGVAVKKSALDPKQFQLAVYRRGEGEGGFNKENRPIRVEVFEGLSMNPNDATFVRGVVNAQSALVRISATKGNTPPDDTASGNKLAEGLTNGNDGLLLDPTGPKPQDFVSALNLEGAEDPGGGIHLLDKVDLFNLLCVPGLTDTLALHGLQEYCHGKRAFFIVDSKQGATYKTVLDDAKDIITRDSLNAALYFPWLLGVDPLAKNAPREFPPCGFVAGIYARTDANRGVWKAAAGTEATVIGALGPKKPLTDVQNGVLNLQGINCIRNFSVYGTIAWGARTLDGSQERASEWKYIPVKRMALFIEETLFRALKWVVFEPNDEPLWSQIRLNVGAFMNDLFRQGALQGRTPEEAYFVKCDKETTTQNDINRGIVNVQVGFAPLKPAEFVIVTIQQMAGQVTT